MKFEIKVILHEFKSFKECFMKFNSFNHLYDFKFENYS